MHDSTKAYLDAAAADEAPRARAIAALRQAAPLVADLTHLAVAKGLAMFASQCDETDPEICAIQYEGQDKLKSIQRVAAEWQEKTGALLKLLQDARAFDERFGSVATAEKKDGPADIRGLVPGLPVQPASNVVT